MNVKIGAKIKELRKRDDITQEQLAEILGVTNQAISKWESENGYPDIEYISPIAEFFNVTIDYLFDHSHRRFRILVIDADKQIKALIYKYLENDYFEVISTEPEQSILEWVIKEQPDLILLDVFESGICNYETLTSLKTSEITRTIPIIILTNQNNLLVKKEVFSLGISDFVAKPFDFSELRSRIAIHLKIPYTWDVVKGKN